MTDCQLLFVDVTLPHVIPLDDVNIGLLAPEPTAANKFNDFDHAIEFNAIVILYTGVHKEPFDDVIIRTLPVEPTAINNPASADHITEFH